MSSSEKCLLGLIHSWTWWEKDFLGLPEDLFHRALIQCVDVGRFILLHAQNVAKELNKLSQDGRQQQRARASEIVNYDLSGLFSKKRSMPKADRYYGTLNQSTKVKEKYPK